MVVDWHSVSQPHREPFWLQHVLLHGLGWCCQLIPALLSARRSNPDWGSSPPYTTTRERQSRDTATAPGERLARGPVTLWEALQGSRYYHTPGSPHTLPKDRSDVERVGEWGSQPRPRRDQEGAATLLSDTLSFRYKKDYFTELKSDMEKKLQGLQLVAKFLLTWGLPYTLSWK